MMVWKRPRLVQGTAQSAALQGILDSSYGVYIVMLEQCAPAVLELARQQIWLQKRGCERDEESVKEA